MTVECSEAAREVLEHLLLLEELESNCLLVLPYHLEHQCLSLLLTSLLSLESSLSGCLSVLLLGKGTLLLCEGLEYLSKRVRHCYLSHCNWRRCRGPKVVSCTLDWNSGHKILVVLRVLGVCG